MYSIKNILSHIGKLLSSSFLGNIIAIGSLFISIITMQTASKIEKIIERERIRAVEKLGYNANRDRITNQLIQISNVLKNEPIDKDIVLDLIKYIDELTIYYASWHEEDKNKIDNFLAYLSTLKYFVRKDNSNSSSSQLECREKINGILTILQKEIYML